MTSLTKNIYFARHGERADFIDKTWHTTAAHPFDPPLSSDGCQQAIELGSYIAQLHPRVTHIYASPFLRTIQTALLVATQLNKNIASPEQMIRIRLESGFGEYFLPGQVWDEKSIFRSLHALSEVSQNLEYFDDDYQSVLNADYYLQLRLESREKLRERLKRVLQSLLDTHKDDCNILIVTHAAPLIEGGRALLTLSKEQNQLLIKKEQVEITSEEEKKTGNLSAWDMSPIRAAVCSLTHFELSNNKWNLAKSGLTSYLSKGEQYSWFFPDDASLYQTVTDQ